MITTLGAYPGTDKWGLTSIGNNIYKIYNTTTEVDVPEVNSETGQGYYGIAQIFNGGEPDSNTRTYFYDPSRTRTVKNEAQEEITLPVYEGKFYDEWYFVSKETYEEWLPKKEIYNAAVVLGKDLDEAAVNCPGLDVSVIQAVYNNPASTAEELKKASEDLMELIVNYKLKDASAETPVDFSEKIVNSTFDVVGDFTGWSKGFGAGGDTSTCAEVWRSAFDVYQDIKGLPEGVYMVACNGYSRHNDNHDQDYAQWKSGAVSETKIYMKSETHGQFFTPVMFVSQGGSIDQQIGTKGQTAHAYEENGEKHTLYCPNSMAAANDYFHDGTNRYRNEAYGPLAAGETLRIGVSNTNSMYWSIFDDFQLFYLGNGADAYKKWAESVKANYNVSFDGEVYYGAPDKKNYEEILATLSDASDKEAVSAAILNVDAAVEAVTTSKNNYATYVKALANAQKWLDENVGDDDSFYKLSDYLEAENAEDVAAWEFPNGPAKVIIPDYLVGGYEGILSGKDIETETTYLQGLLAEATKNALADGSDLTSMIVNPGFEEAGGKGWKLDTSKGGTNALTNWHGGNDNNYCAEAFQQNFDIYQEIEGVKDGLYEVSVQAFYRTGANQAAYEAYKNDPEMKGDAKVYPEVYINEFSSKIRNVMEIQFKDKELDENNTNTYHPDGTEIYTLDGMTSASNAFSLEDPARNFTMSAYGVVQDGKIRIGLRKLEGPTNAAQWTLWDNFKLTYRAKNPEVAAKVLASKSEELAELLEASADFMTDPVLKNTQDAYNESKKTDLNDAAKYDVLIETNDALLAAQENIKNVEKYKEVMVAFDQAYTDLETEDSDNALWTEIDKLSDELEGDAYLSLTNEELAELLEYVRSAPLYMEVTVPMKRFVLVHGGLKGFDPAKGLDEYSEDDLVWTRPAADDRYWDDRLVILGHTPTQYYGTKRDSVVVSNVAKMAEELDMSVITEGVEKWEQVEFLKSVNIDMVQGFLFDKPMPKEAFEKRLWHKVYD